MAKHYDTIIVVETIIIMASLIGIALIIQNVAVSLINGMLIIPLSIFVAIVTNKIIKHMNWREAYRDFCPSKRRGNETGGRKTDGYCEMARW
ncbi:hypothetical protein LCGC14_0341430 [marine sediment metagenome]|uniref:Uncharacterized protein n=1 Tax=marine sediment metagenome TaxID=412755 RepID=A0A0F9W127_9ZZZZ